MNFLISSKTCCHPAERCNLAVMLSYIYLRSFHLKKRSKLHILHLIYVYRMLCKERESLDILFSKMCVHLVCSSSAPSVAIYFLHGFAATMSYKKYINSPLTNVFLSSSATVGYPATRESCKINKLP